MMDSSIAQILVDFDQMKPHHSSEDPKPSEQSPVKTYRYVSKTLTLTTDAQNKPHEIMSEDSYNKLYDFETVSRYRSYRIKKQDPITCQNLTDENAFTFDSVWDCLTGERVAKDPYGPMYINPVTILRTYCNSILDGLWIEMEGCFPAYGEQLGKGENFYTEGKGRGDQPEKYLFRLPITDCYVYKEQNQNIHTMGPRLTTEEINEIDRLITDHWLGDPYIEKIHYAYTDNFTLRLKEYYDVAICMAPTILENQNRLPDKIDSQYQAKVAMGHLNDTNHDSYINRIAVDAIKELICYRSQHVY